MKKLIDTIRGNLVVVIMIITLITALFFIGLNSENMFKELEKDYDRDKKTLKD